VWDKPSSPRISVGQDSMHEIMTSKSKRRSKAGVYVIKHTPSGTLYVGQADDVCERWQEHRKRLRASTHHNKGLQKLWNESAEKDFQYECCTFDKPISAEQREKKRKIESLRNAIAPVVRRSTAKVVD
ncbi:MAG: GIY-YIG nuclease family protein, partial [Acidiferrobacterales bacterium]